MDTPRYQTVGFKYLLRGKIPFGSVVTVNLCRALYAFVSGHWDEARGVSPEALSRMQWLPAAWNKPADANMQVTINLKKILWFHSFRTKKLAAKTFKYPSSKPVTVLVAVRCSSWARLHCIPYTGPKQFKAGVCSKNWTVFFLHFWRIPNTQQHLLISNRQPFSAEAIPSAFTPSHWDKPVVLKQEFKSYSCYWAYYFMEYSSHYLENSHQQLLIKVDIKAIIC